MGAEAKQVFMYPVTTGSYITAGGRVEGTSPMHFLLVLAPGRPYFMVQKEKKKKKYL